MRTQPAVKLAAFAVALASVFGVGAIVGATVGPDRAPSDHSDMEMDMDGGHGS
jgi:hypothetical protein